MITDLEKHMPITKDKIITWSDYRREDGKNTFGLLSQISPDGRYVLSTVKDRWWPVICRAADKLGLAENERPTISEDSDIIDGLIKFVFPLKIFRLKASLKNV